MKKPVIRRNNLSVIIALLFTMSMVLGCGMLQIADYDSKTAEAVVTTAKSVDIFYGKLLETSPDQREYSSYSDSYVELETELRALVMMNKIRPLNTESTQIAEIILEMWIKYKDAHKTKNEYKDALAKLHRKRFIRLFTAMTVAEEAKKMASGENQ